MLVEKQLEVALYKQAVSAKGSDAQQMLKASIEDMVTLRTENTKLREALDSQNFEQRYCAAQP